MKSVIHRFLFQKLKNLLQTGGYQRYVSIEMGRKFIEILWSYIPDRRRKENFMTNGKKTMIKTIQGLRGVAALLILLSHYTFVKRMGTIFPDGGVEEGQNVLMWIGAMGVSIFIILSGFLTYLNYGDRTSPYDVKEKLVSQYKRFWPLHIITMVLAIPLLLRVYMAEPINTAIKIFFNTTILHAWMPHMGIYYSFNAVSWYLSLAVFFTIMTPIMLRFVKRAGDFGRYGIPTLILIILILQSCIGIAGDKVSEFEAIGAGHWLVYICPIIRFGDFLLGGGNRTYI